ncbi:MAG: hypothetical protein LUF82_01630 [Clostridia bacterium]|nr:hypothetical protein [Clostridia bacterium]
MDEINAHLAEKTLSNKNILERLVADEKKPTLKEKILNFFKGAKTDYAEDAKLSKAAEKLYKQYKTLFDEFSERNYQNNAVDETERFTVDEDGNKHYLLEQWQKDAEAKTETKDGVETIRYAQMNNKPFSENVKDIATMTDEEALYRKSEDNYIKVMDETPDVIIKYVDDAENLEVVMKFEALYLSVRKDGAFNKENSNKYHYHNLGVELATKLPEYISNPEAIVRVRARNGTERLNLLTTVQTKKGNNGIISIELGTVKDINSKHNKYNLIVTAFSADDNYTRNTIDGAIRVEYEKNDLSQVNHQLHKWLASVNEKSLNESDNAAQDRSALSNNSISNPDKKVNTKTKKSSKKSENDTVRKALPTTDSDGRTLIAEQRDYFKDIKVVWLYATITTLEKTLSPLPSPYGGRWWRSRRMRGLLLTA